MINKPEYISVIAELNFALLRMNIYVDSSGLAVDHEETYRELVLHYRIFISLIYCCGNSLAVNESSVNEYTLKTSVTSYKRCNAQAYY